MADSRLIEFQLGLNRISYALKRWNVHFSYLCIKVTCILSIQSIPGHVCQDLSPHSTPSPPCGSWQSPWWWLCSTMRRPGLGKSTPYSETFQHQRCGRGPVDRVHNKSPKRCQYGHRWGILFRVWVRSLLASSESLDNVHEPENKRKVRHEVNVKQSKFYLLTYWILLLARPVFFFFFSPASTLGVWPLTWKMW